MKTGEVAKMMGVNPKTITNWTDQGDIAEFFSTTARALNNVLQRDYSPDDVLVINTIRLHKSRQNTWQDIAELLRSKHRETELPLSAALTKTISPVDQVTGLMVIKAERDTALAQLQDAMAEVDRLRSELKEEREDSFKQINELYKQVGRLEEKVETLQAELKKSS
jgi:DNA-binding transcriptional MerR regulator